MFDSRGHHSDDNWKTWALQLLWHTSMIHSSTSSWTYNAISRFAYCLSTVLRCNTELTISHCDEPWDVYDQLNSRHVTPWLMIHDPIHWTSRKKKLFSLQTLVPERKQSHNSIVTHIYPFNLVTNLAHFSSLLVPFCIGFSSYFVGSCTAGSDPLDVGLALSFWLIDLSPALLNWV